MDGPDFDRIARRLAMATDRRSVVRGFAAGLLATAGLRQSGAAAPPSKVTICHWDAALGAYQQLAVPAKAANAHAKHAQDIVAPDFASPATCGGCNTACPTPEHGTATCAAESCGIRCDAGYQPDAAGTACELEPCGPFLTHDAAGNCVNPCTLGTCFGCASRLCGVNPDASAFCVNGHWEWGCDAAHNSVLHIYSIVAGVVADTCRPGNGANIVVEGDRSSCSTS
jgi:hypothetical protein